MPNTEFSTPADRRDERTHLFVIATLFFNRSSIPVRIRNLSPSGALIEGSGLPPIGAEVSLRRGNLEAKGMTVWTASGKSGLTFGSTVSIAAWLSKKEPSQQRQIDQYVFGVKHAGKVTDFVRDIFIEEANLPLSPVVAGLECLQVELSQLADKLAQDVILVATHPEVQFLDEAVQRIGKIIQTIQMPENHIRPLSA